MYKAKYFIQSSSIKQRQSKTLCSKFNYRSNVLEFTGNRPDLLCLLLTVLNKTHITERWLGRVHMPGAFFASCRVTTRNKNTKQIQSDVAWKTNLLLTEATQDKHGFHHNVENRFVLIKRCWSVERRATTMKEVFLNRTWMSRWVITYWECLDPKD